MKQGGKEKEINKLKIKEKGGGRGWVGGSGCLEGGWGGGGEGKKAYLNDACVHNRVPLRMLHKRELRLLAPSRRSVEYCVTSNAPCIFVCVCVYACSVVAA